MGPKNKSRTPKIVLREPKLPVNFPETDKSNVPVAVAQSTPTTDNKRKLDTITPGSSEAESKRGKDGVDDITAQDSSIVSALPSYDTTFVPRSRNSSPPPLGASFLDDYPTPDAVYKHYDIQYEDCDGDDRIMKTLGSKAMQKLMQAFVSETFKLFLAEQNKKLDKIENSFQNLILRVDKVEKQNRVLHHRLETCEKQNVELKNENISLKDEMLKHHNAQTVVVNNLKSTMFEKVEELEMYGRRNGIRVYGIPEQPGEDAVKTVIEVLNGKLPNVNLERKDFCRGHRVGEVKPNVQHPRPIILKLIRHDRKFEIISARRALAGSNIVIREDVTKHRAGLMSTILKYAKDAKVQHKSVSVWSTDGRIKVKVGNKISKIRLSAKYCDDDVAEIKTSIDALPKQ